MAVGEENPRNEENMPMLMDEVETLKDPHSRLKRCRVRSMMGMVVAASFMAAIGFAMARASATQTVKTQNVMGLSSTPAYQDLGYGKCQLESGGDPKYRWLSSGNFQALCDADPTCTGYSKAGSTSALLWYSGPLKGGGQRWGSCKCMKKIMNTPSAALPPTPSAALPPPASSSSDLSALSSNNVPIAEDGKPTYWPNIGMATVGYNIFYGDPLPIVDPQSLTSKSAMVDPGLTKPLFVVEYSQSRTTGDHRHIQPDGYHATVDEGCSTVFATKTIRDDYEYQQDAGEKMSLTGTVTASIEFPQPYEFDENSKAGKVQGAWNTVNDHVTVADAVTKQTGASAPQMSVSAFATASGTLSAQRRQLDSEKFFRSQKMFRTDAKCSAYVVAFSYVKPPKTHPDFQKAVDNLGTSDSYYDLFDKYGSHFLTTVRMGARHGSSIFVENSKTETMEKTVNGIGLSVEASMGAAVKAGVQFNGTSHGLFYDKTLSAKLPLLTPQEKTVAQALKNDFVNKQTTSVVGPPLPVEGVSMWHGLVKTNPVPIQWDSEPICMHPSFAGEKRSNCHQRLTTYCVERLRQKGATCEPAQEKECFNDLDCGQDKVCRRWKCLEVPKCVVKLFSKKGYVGEMRVLETVTRVSHPNGKWTDLASGGWSSKVWSMALSKGCEKVLLKKKGTGTKYITQSKSGNVDRRQFPVPMGFSVMYVTEEVTHVKVEAKALPPDPPAPGNPDWLKLRHMKVSTSSDSAGDGGKRAVDGNRDTTYNHGSCTHTKSQSNPWWKVDLGENFDVEAVRVTNRGDCCGDRLNHFDIYVGDQCCQYSQTISSGQTKELPCQRTGSSVKIALRGGSRILSLCEVEVKAGLPKNRRLLEQNLESVLPGHNSTMGKQLRSSSTFLPVREDLDGKVGPKIHDRRLQNARYLKNIGKVMYGYNHFYGAPSSSSNAGTDPGFVHRPVWKTSYTRGSVVTMKTFDSVPKASYQATKAPPAGAAGWLNLEGFGVWASSGSNNKRAIDRKANPYFHKGQSCTQSNTEWNPWWKVDLGERYEVLEVAVTNPVDCCHGNLNGFDVYVDNVKCSSNNMIGAGERKNVVCKASGSSVKISVPKKTSLVLCEVGVLAKLPMGSQRRLSVSHEAPLLAKLPMAPQRRLSVSDEKPPFVFGPRRLSADAEKVPDGWKVVKAVQTVCDKHFSTREIRSKYDYQREESYSLNPLGISISIGDFSFSLSHETNDFVKANSKYKKALYKTSAECLEYVAELDLINPPPVSDNFKYVAESAENEQEFHILFDMFGLHFPTKMIFGAKYGFTRNIDESSWSDLTKSSSSTDIGVSISKSIETGYEDQGAEVSASASLNFGVHDKQSQQQKFDSHFTEIKEFSLGRAMPRQGGVAEWVKQVDSEPMPIRYGLKSICEHPSLALKKAQCLQSSATYCTNHLQKAKEGTSCDEPRETQCLWDLDCLANNKCVEGVCTPLPSCTVVLYEKPNFQGVKTRYGPYFHAETPNGRRVDTPDDGKVASVAISAGCAEVIFMDADSGGCLENRDDNLVLNNRGQANGKGYSNVGYDLEDDICSIKVHIKKEW